MTYRFVLFVGVALVLALASVTTPSAQTWPGKNDKVFVAATLKDLRSLTSDRKYGMLITLKPCQEGLTIRDATPDKSRWTAQYLDIYGPKVQLEGPWLSRMHKTEADCRSQLAAEGEPKVKRSGTTYKITPAK